VSDGKLQAMLHRAICLSWAKGYYEGCVDGASMPTGEEISAIEKECLTLAAPATAGEAAVAPKLVMDTGEYSCAVCGMGMQEPCEHWRKFQSPPASDIALTYSVFKGLPIQIITCKMVQDATGELNPKWNQEIADALNAAIAIGQPAPATVSSGYLRELGRLDKGSQDVSEDYCQKCGRMLMRPDVNYGIHPDAACKCPKGA
jgi:hypothetical protein